MLLLHEWADFYTNVCTLWWTHVSLQNTKFESIMIGITLQTSKAYSKTWSFREDALLEVYRSMSSLSPSASKEEARNMIRAAVFLVNRASKDKVFAVYTAGLNLLKMILTQFVVDQRSVTATRSLCDSGKILSKLSCRSHTRNVILLHFKKSSMNLFFQLLKVNVSL